jgi:2-dehydropantoate 2-reductase
VRFVVIGAGAVGGVVGGRLAQHGEEVVLVARGEHGRAIAARGLSIESAEGVVRVEATVVESIADVVFTTDDVAVLAVKSQDTQGALDELRAVAAEGTPIVCLQNGVANERAALRLFPNVYGVCVMCPAGYLEPGVVQAYAAPVAAILDIGRYPTGSDATALAIAAAFERATLVSAARPDIMRWKYAKLLMNLLNGIDALFPPGDNTKAIVEMVQAEGEAALHAASIDFASKDEDAARRGDILQQRPIPGHERAGGSTRQSLARGTRTVETDYLNGEIVLLGRLHGVDVPANALLQRRSRHAATTGARPGSADADDFLAALRRGARPRAPLS